MTMPGTPPRTPERLLEALGAEPEFRDALLGDLAEEFAIRAAYDGDHSARRWYWMEAFRVAPHLLRDWARRLRPRGVARLAGAVGAAYFSVGAFAYAVLVVLEAVVERIRGQTTLPWHDPHAGTLALCGLLLGDVAVAATGGWLAAKLEDRSPAVAAAALGVVWAMISVLAPLPLRASLPAWYLLGQTVAVLAGSMLGGVGCIATRQLSRTHT